MRRAHLIQQTRNPTTMTLGTVSAVKTNVFLSALCVALSFRTWM